MLEHFAVLHDLAVKECLWKRKNLSHKAARSFVCSRQGDSPLVPASGCATGRWGAGPGKFHGLVTAHSSAMWPGGYRLVPRVAQCSILILPQPM